MFGWLGECKKLSNQGWTHSYTCVVFEQHYVVENTWNGDEAAAFFSRPLRNALARKYPRLRARRVLEDNDPGGYLSGKAIAAKKEMPKYAKFHIPKRSPDLNVLDY